MQRFDTLLQDLSVGQGQERVEILPENSPPALSDHGATAPLPGSHAYSVLESLLPRILPQTNSGGQTNPEARGGASPMLRMPASGAAADAILSPGIGPKISVSVQNQETHFRPIVEGFETALQETDGSAAPFTGALPATVAVNRTKGPSTRLPFANPQGHAGDKPTVPDTDTARIEQEESWSGDRISSTRMGERGEVQGQSAPGLQKADGGSLPPGTLHQMARAILDDVAGIAEPPQLSLQSNGLNRVAVARASGGVLRVLSLQLNPIELGPVTVKMRLSGDNLEMELQVEKQETAELLRNDAEKLSSLLRTSGYRPDVISIQTADSTNHDRNSFQRPHQDPQDQSFQSNAEGQGNPSAQHSRQYGREKAEPRNETKQDLGSDRRGLGGVYL